MITAEPDVAHITLQPEDEFLLLACDGVWDVMTNQEVRGRVVGCGSHGIWHSSRRWDWTTSDTEHPDSTLILFQTKTTDAHPQNQAIDFIRQRLPSALAAGKPVSTVAEELLDACLADDPRKSAGIGGDNFTCLIVQLKDRPGGFCCLCVLVYVFVTVVECSRHRRLR